MRLIDADALREVMYHEVFEKDSDMQKWDSGCWIRYKLFENAIENATTVQPDSKEMSSTHKALDTISRQAAIDALSNPHGVLYPIRTVEELPSAEQWIPVTERLPNEDGWYLITSIFTEIDGVLFPYVNRAKYEDGAWVDEFGNQFNPPCITAWMPLPEPYRETEE